MASGQTTPTRPLGIKLICWVEGVGGAIVGLILLGLVFQAILEGEPAKSGLTTGLTALIAVTIVILYGLWSFTAWGWWGAVIAHILSILFSGWSIFASVNPAQSVIRLTLAVLIVVYLNTKRDLYL